MKVDRKIFFENNWIEYNRENLKKYNNGWTFSEIRLGKEFVIEEYKENYELYFNLQKDNFN